MNRYNRLLVALNLLEDEDKSTLEYASLISRIAQSDSVHIVHITESLDLPKELILKHRPTATSLGRILQERVDEYFDTPDGTVVKVQVSEGAPLVELLRIAKKYEVDLIIAGASHKKLGGRKIPERLARKASCSVLVLPADTIPVIKKIFLPIDFSEHSADALDVAIAFGRAAGINELVCFHMYPVPLGYSESGESFQEFDTLMRSRAIEKYDQFMSGRDLRGLRVRPIFVYKDKPGYGIIEVARNEHADLVVIGAKGRTASAIILLGSLTQRIIANTETPLVVVKRKGAEASIKFLEAFLKI